MELKTIRLALTPGRPLDLTHRRFCQFLKAIIIWKRANVFNQRVTYKDAFRLASEAVKREGGKVVDFSENRRGQIISKWPANLHADEISFLAKAFDLYYRLGIPDDAWDKIITLMGQTQASEVSTRMEAKDEDAFRHLGLLAKILGLSRVPASQERLKFMAGDYLLFRLIEPGKRLLVSHFSIFPPPSDDSPAFFLTIGSAGGVVRDEREVEGIIYEPLEVPGFFFTIGKIKNSSEIRSAVLMAVQKPTRLDNPPADFIDLTGIRLGLGRLDRQPLAYRIWCSRLVGDPPDPPWRTYAREYTLDQASAVLATKVIGFDYIMRWLSNAPPISFTDPDHPLLD